MSTQDNSNFLRRLPKVELHLHLEGAIPLPALAQLIEKYEPPGPGRKGMDRAELERRFTYRDFAHFIDTWQWKNGFLREYEDFTYIAAAVAADLAEQNIRYVEAFYSPGDFERHGLELGRLTEAIRKGLATQAETVQVLLIADLVRDYGPERGRRWLRQAAEVQELGVIGIGIGGSEQAFPPEPYAEVYEEARRLGFRTTAHAGEAAGAESVWGALRALRADRIGHATRAAEDPALVEVLREQRIPLEMCPLSNVRTGVVARLEEHPLRDFFDRGLLVSIHTDDPKMFNTSLDQEALELMGRAGFTREEILQLFRNAVDSAWCDEVKKQALRRELEEAASTHRGSR